MVCARQSAVENRRGGAVFRLGVFAALCGQPFAAVVQIFGGVRRGDCSGVGGRKIAHQEPRIRLGAARVWLWRDVFDRAGGVEAAPHCACTAGVCRDAGRGGSDGGFGSTARCPNHGAICAGGRLGGTGFDFGRLGQPCGSVCLSGVAQHGGGVDCVAQGVARAEHHGLCGHVCHRAVLGAARLHGGAFCYYRAVFAVSLAALHGGGVLFCAANAIARAVVRQPEKHSERCAAGTHHGDVCRLCQPYSRLGQHAAVWHGDYGVFHAVSDGGTLATRGGSFCAGLCGGVCRLCVVVCAAG